MAAIIATATQRRLVTSAQSRAVRSGSIKARGVAEASAAYSQLYRLTSAVAAKAASGDGWRPPDGTVHEQYRDDPQRWRQDLTGSRDVDDPTEQPVDALEAERRHGHVVAGDQIVAEQLRVAEPLQPEQVQPRVILDDILGTPGAMARAVNRSEIVSAARSATAPRRRPG